MGKLTNLNPSVALTNSDIPGEIARDTETAAAITAHAGAADPHTQYLLQSEGDARYRRTAVALTESDIPGEIARDTETAAAIAAHAGATDPHAQYLLQSEGDARYRRSAVALTDADIPAGIARDTETAAAIAAHAGAFDPHSQYEYRASLASRIINGPLNYPVNTWSSFGNFATFSPGSQGAPSAVVVGISFSFNFAGALWQQACCGALLCPIWWQPASVGDPGTRVWLEFHNQTGFYVNLRFGPLSGDLRQLQINPESIISIANTGRVDVLLKRLF